MTDLMPNHMSVVCLLLGLFIGGTWLAFFMRARVEHADGRTKGNSEVKRATLTKQVQSRDQAVADINEMRVIFQEYGTQLSLDKDDRLVLSVLCGRVGQYGVDFALNDQEREQYKTEGDSFVKRLALQVRQNPRFLQRSKR